MSVNFNVLSSFKLSYDLYVIGEIGIESRDAPLEFTTWMFRSMIYVHIQHLICLVNELVVQVIDCCSNQRLHWRMKIWSGSNDLDQVGGFKNQIDTNQAIGKKKFKIMSI